MSWLKETLEELQMFAVLVLVVAPFLALGVGAFWLIDWLSGVAP